MNPKTLLETYYAALKRPAEWAPLLADDFRFIGGDMTKPDPVVGRDAYVAILTRLSNAFSAVRVERMFFDGDQAVVLARYDWTFPKGGTVPGTVAEVWTIRDGKLQSLTIFFDTFNFDRLMKG